MALGCSRRMRSSPKPSERMSKPLSPLQPTVVSARWRSTSGAPFRGSASARPNPAVSRTCAKNRAGRLILRWASSKRELCVTHIERIVWGAFGGPAVYVAGQILSKFAIESLYALRKPFGEVRFNLAFHAPTIHTPIGRSKESSDAAREVLRKDSCDLIARL